MLEAGAMKKPFIGGNTGGIAEFIEDGVNGILIEPGDSDQLADKIIFLLNNPVQAELLANALYQKVKKECDCVKYFERLDKFITNFGLTFKNYCMKEHKIFDIIVNEITFQELLGYN